MLYSSYRTTSHYTVLREISAIVTHMGRGSYFMAYCTSNIQIHGQGHSANPLCTVFTVCMPCVPCMRAHYYVTHVCYICENIKKVYNVSNV